MKEKDIKDLRLGGRIPQFNSWSKVTGTLRYAQDIYLEDMCHAKVLRSPYFHAKIKSINTAEAEAMRGVVAVATAADLKGPNRVKYIDQDFRVLADNKVRYFGEPVAIVVARTEQLAAKALEMIKVDYEELPFVTNPFDALKEGAPEVQEEDFRVTYCFIKILSTVILKKVLKKPISLKKMIFTLRPMRTVIWSRMPA